MSHKEAYFATEEEASLFARNNNGICERQDHKLLGPDRVSKPYIVKYGPGIVPPPAVPINLDQNGAQIAQLQSMVLSLQQQILEMGSKRGKKDE